MVTDGFVSGGCDAFALELGEIDAAGCLPDVGVHRNRLHFVEGEEADAVGEFRANSAELQERLDSFIVGFLLELAQPIFPAPFHDLPRGFRDGFGSVSKAFFAEFLFGDFGKFFDTWEKVLLAVGCQCSDHRSDAENMVVAGAEEGEEGFGRAGGPHQSESREPAYVGRQFGSGLEDFVLKSFQIGLQAKERSKILLVCV